MPAEDTMRLNLVPWFAAAVLAVAVTASAQGPKSNTEVEKYPNGAIKSQETTMKSADGTQTLWTIRTDYDEAGRPLNETQTINKPNGGVALAATHTKTWVYDDQGRLLYFESSDEDVQDVANFKPGLLTRYRVRRKYSGNDDKTGTPTTEQVYSSITGKWRDFDSDGGDTQPPMAPLQPLRPDQIKKPAEKLRNETNPAPDNGEGLPLPKTKFGGGINFMHAPDELATSLIGFDVMAAYRVTSQLWIVGDVISVSGSETRMVGGVTFDQSVSRLIYAGGAEFTFPAHGHLVPFVRGLIGEVHDTNRVGTGSSVGTALAVDVGAGVNVSLSHSLWASIGIDLISARFANAQQNLRFFGGLSYGFGADRGR